MPFLYVTFQNKSKSLRIIIINGNCKGKSCGLLMPALFIWNTFIQFCIRPNFRTMTSIKMHKSFLNLFKKEHNIKIVKYQIRLARNTHFWETKWWKDYEGKRTKISICWKICSESIPKLILPAKKKREREKIIKSSLNLCICKP